MTGIVRDYPVMLKWYAVIVLATASQLGCEQHIHGYTSYRYGWSTADLGVYLSYFSCWAIFLQAVVVRS